MRLLGYGGVSPLMSIPFLFLSLFIAKRLHGLRFESENRSTDHALSTTQQSFEMLETSTRNNGVLSQPSEKPRRTMPHKIVDQSVTLGSRKVTERRSRESVGSDTVPVFNSSQFTEDFKTTAQPLEIHVERNVTLTTEEGSRKFSVDHADSPPDFSGFSVSPQRQALDSLTKYETAPPFNSLYPPDSSEHTSATPLSSTKLLFSPGLPRASQIIDFDNLFSEKREADSKVPPWEVTEYDEKGRSISNPSEAQLRALKNNSKFVNSRGTSRNIHPKKLTGAYRRMILLQM